MQQIHPNALYEAYEILEEAAVRLVDDEQLSKAEKWSYFTYLSDAVYYLRMTYGEKPRG
jgi:hypothetical protein